MKYQVGSPGRIIVARFEDGDDLLAGITGIARREGIGAAQFQVVGGIRRARYVVGPATEEMPPVPVWREMAESHEVIAWGTIFRQGEEPKVHCHGAWGRGDTVRAGCLREQVETFLVMEVVITEMLGITATREYDPQSGMVLLKL
jgi:predicted DNA-binding protein with PD1-like motif